MSRQLVKHRRVRPFGRTFQLILRKDTDHSTSPIVERSDHVRNLYGLDLHLKNMQEF